MQNAKLRLGPGCAAHQQPQQRHDFTWVIVHYYHAFAFDSAMCEPRPRNYNYASNLAYIHYVHMVGKKWRKSFLVHRRPPSPNFRFHTTRWSIYFPSGTGGAGGVKEKKQNTCKGETKEIVL
jgi:hypothetical protein